MGRAFVEIDYELCENTQSCEAVCPFGVFEIVDGRSVVTAAGECTACFKCVEMCPGGAIDIDN
jgi:NAD-dependent dihydropyrimidine dehydrogenase PreA subunit